MKGKEKAKASRLREKLSPSPIHISTTIPTSTPHSTSRYFSSTISSVPFCDIVPHLSYRWYEFNCTVEEH